MLGGVILQAGLKSPSRPSHFSHAFSVCIVIGLGEGCCCFSRTVSYRFLKLWHCVQLQKMKAFLTRTYQVTCETMHFAPHYPTPSPTLEYNSNYFQIYQALLSGYFHISSQNRGFFYPNSSYNYCLSAGEKLCLNYPCFIIHTML